MEELEKTIADAEAVRKSDKVKLSMHKVDVSDRENVAEFALEVMEEHGEVHLLFANAGIIGAGELILEGKTVEEVAALEKSWDRCFNVDYFGVLYCVREFMPHIVKQKEGYIVLVTSVNGIMTWPNHGSYTSAKFAVRGLAESLIFETYIKAPHVHIASVHPGKVNTKLVGKSMKEMKDAYKFSEDEIVKKNNGYELDTAGLSSADAADWILFGVLRNKTKIMVGYDAVGFDFIKRTFEHQVYRVYAEMGRLGWGWGLHFDMVKQFEELDRDKALRLTAEAYPYALFVFPSFALMSTIGGRLLGAVLALVGLIVSWVISPLIAALYILWIAFVVYQEVDFAIARRAFKAK